MANAEMPPSMRQVFSSRVDSIGHDAETNELHVVWQRGKRSVYQNVPTDLARQIMNSSSVGKALHEHIIGKTDKHGHSYVE